MFSCSYVKVTFKKQNCKMLRICRLSAKTNIVRQHFHAPSVTSASSQLLKYSFAGNEILHRKFSYQETVAGIWKSISNSTPVAYLQDGLLLLHDSTCLPWWATIVISTVLLRTVITLPFAVYQVSWAILCRYSFF